MRTISIAERSIGINHPPLVIAEMSGNHNQSLDRALELVDAAADAGAGRREGVAPPSVGAQTVHCASA